MASLRKGYSSPFADAPPAREKRRSIFTCQGPPRAPRAYRRMFSGFSPRPSSGQLYYNRWLEDCQHKNAIFQKFFSSIQIERSRGRFRAAAAAAAPELLFTCGGYFPAGRHCPPHADTGVVHFPHESKISTTPFSLQNQNPTQPKIPNPK